MNFSLGGDCTLVRQKSFLQFLFACWLKFWILQRQLYNVWVKTSELRTSVAVQRIKLQRARQTHKLRCILSTHVSKATLAGNPQHIMNILEHIQSNQQFLCSFCSILLQKTWTFAEVFHNTWYLFQATHLEDWEMLEEEHSNALTGCMEALESAILRVPVTGGARVREVLM